MHTYRFTLAPANRKINVNFKHLEDNYRIFSTAADNCNSGVTFRRAEKKIVVEQITEKQINLTLSSATELPSPTRTLSAYSRELIRLDKESGLLNSLIYNHTLFRTELIETVKAPQKSIDTISYAELLKAIIDLLYSSTKSYNTKQKNDAITKLKEIVLPFM